MHWILIGVGLLLILAGLGFHILNIKFLLSNHGFNHLYIAFTVLGIVGGSVTLMVGFIFLAVFLLKTQT